MVASVYKWSLNVRLSFLWMLIPMIFLGGAEGNLLTFDRKTTSSPKLAGVRNLLPLFPKNSKRRPETSNFAAYQIYFDFISAYSDFKKWESVHLLFPKVDKRVCVRFKVFLLKSSGIISECHESGTFESSSGSDGTLNRDKLKLVTRRKDPIVVCHFMRSLSARRESVNVNPKFLIDYPADVFVVTSNFENGESVIDEIQPEISTNYKWTLASRRNDSKFEIEDIYGIVNSPVPIRNPIGFWSYEKGISIEYDKLKGPKDFQRRTLRITTFEAPPVVYVEKSRGKLYGKGYLPDILELISSELNFTYSLSVPPDDSFGSKMDNGTWSGMVGVLQRKEAEIALHSFGYTPGRKEAMDFSPPVEYSSTRLLIRKDWRNTELKWKAYSEPFDWQVWLAIPWIIVLGVSSFIAFTHYKLMQTTPSQSAWFLSACFLQQGLEEHSSVRRFPCRLALGSFWLLAVVLYASYTARLTSFLAATTETLPINSLAEAVENRYWKIGIVKGSSITDRVQESTVPEMRKMWNRISSDSSGYVSGFKEGLERVYEDRYIFFTSDLVPAFLIKGNCTYTWIPGKFFPGFGYMGYSKNLPYKASISIQLAKIRESGQMKRLFKKWWGTASSCSIFSASGEFNGMSLYETGTAFLLLIFGIILAIAFLLIEFYIHLENPFNIHRKINEEKTIPSPESISSIPSHYSHTLEMDDNKSIPGPDLSNTQDEPSVIHYHEYNIKKFFLKLTTPFTERQNSQEQQIQGGSSFSMNF